MISEKRLATQLAHIQTISSPSKNPGINRLAFTDSDWKCRSYLISLMKKAGMTVRTDAFGNVIGHLTGTDESLPSVMFGSHGDSVPNGGNFDGIVGILSAIEVVKSIKEDKFKNENPLEVVLFMCEESSRFGAGTLGSRTMRGEITTNDLHRFIDQDGYSLYEVLKSRKLDPDHIESARYDRPLKCFFELHIEQGKVLEHLNVPIGIVTGISAPTRFFVRLHGSADHSGATPMKLRLDGSCAAAEIILQMEQIAAAHTAPHVVGTVGVIHVHPCSMNVIPGEVELGIDIRSISAQAKAETVDAMYRHIVDICKKRKISYDIEEISNEKPAIIQPEVIHFLTGLCKKNGWHYHKMPSGAGHDAMHWAEYAPTGMLFIPCKGGISHNAAESTEFKYIVSVARLLEEAVRTVSHAEFHF